MPNKSGSLFDYLREISGVWKNDTRGDAELLARFVESRDEIAFKVLVHRHGGMVWQTCRRILGDTPDVEDVFQSTFMALTRKARLFPIRSLAGWLHRVARQASLNVYASTRRRQRIEQPLQTEIQSVVKKDLYQDELNSVLDDEIAGLPEKLRVPLVLHFLEEKTQDEVARILGCSPGSICRRLERGETILRQRLEQRGLALGIGSIAALLGNTTETPAVPASLITGTARAAVAFRSGALTGAKAESAQKLLRALTVLSPK